MTIGKEGTGIVNVAASVRVNGAIAEPRVAIGCVAAVPVRAADMEEQLAGAAPTEASVMAAAQGLGAALDPPSDVHASADYRRHLAEVIAVRATMAALEAEFQARGLPWMAVANDFAPARGAELRRRLRHPACPRFPSFSIG